MEDICSAGNYNAAISQLTRFRECLDEVIGSIESLDCE
jgi:hypothetical protein